MMTMMMIIVTVIKMKTMNDTPVYSVGVDNGLKHDSLLKAIVGLADHYININLLDFNDDLVDIAMIIWILSLRLSK